MLRVEQLRAAPRQVSTATNAPGDRKLVSKSQPNLQHISICKIPACPFPKAHSNDKKFLAGPHLLSRHRAFRSLRYFVTALLSSNNYFSPDFAGRPCVERRKSCALTASRAGKHSRTSRGSQVCTCVKNAVRT